MEFNWLFILAPIAATLALLFAYLFYKQIMKHPEGTERMKEIAEAVKVGAKAYLRRQYMVVAIFFVVTSLFLAFLSFVLKVQSRWTAFAFLTGGFFSALSGYLGMMAATSSSARTAHAATESLNKGLRIAFRAGAIMGLVVVGLGLIDISIWFSVLHYLVKYDLRLTTVTLLSFGMGASLQALFARVGGGIFTKAADVGADLVGKVEAGIPEDDPRNPAVIADNVGDNVGDVAGMGADLYESYTGSILSSAALGASAFYATQYTLNAVILPMVIAAIGMIASIIGIYLVKAKEEASQKNLLNALNRGIYGASLLILIATYFIIKLLLPHNMGIFGSVLTGLIVGLIIGKSTEYYTSSSYKPTKFIASQSLTGPATTILAGLSEGMISTFIPVTTVAVGIILAFWAAGGFTNPIYGLYGIGIAAVGMLSTLGITLATDAYGPVADNAGGNAQMAELPPEVRKRTDALDALGNTTAATGKGFAIGSAALTALALLAAYIEEVRGGLIRLVENGWVFKDIIKVVGKSDTSAIINWLHHATISDFMNLFAVNLMNPKVIVGVFIGAMMPFFFSGLAIKAVGKAASQMVEEVRRQFREIKGLLEGKAKPDYETCVEISTRGAQKAMVFPALSAVLAPIFTGLILGVSGVMGLLIGALSSGFIMAIFMANAGGAWDNAKKFIEEGNYGGKGSDPHKAGVVGDTVGDPLKDTAGPSINILIKLMSMVSVVVAGLVVAYHLL